MAELSLSGTVFDAEEAPVAGAAVWLSQERQIRETTTDAEGNFRFAGVDVGAVEVVAYKPGLAVGGYTGFLAGEGMISIHLLEPATLTLRIRGPEYEPVPGAHMRSMRVNNNFHVPVEDLVPHGFPRLRSNDAGVIEVPLLPEDAVLRIVVGHYDYADLMVPFLPVLADTQDFTLEPGVELRGRVMRGEDGVSGARVLLLLSTDQGSVVRAQALSDEEGLYRMRAPAGGYTLGVRHPDYAAPPPEAVLLDADAEEEIVNLELRAPRFITGRVVQENEQPSAGVRVAYRVGDTIYEETFTQHDGTFRLKVGTKEGVLLVVPPSGYMLESFEAVPFDMGDKQQVELAPITLVPLPEITGRVLDADGNGVPKALVETVGLMPPYWSVTDEEGKYFIQLPRMPESPEVALLAQHRLRLWRKQFAVDLRQRRQHDVELAPYEPDLEERPVTGNRNDLSGLVGEPAPPLACDTWINADEVTIEDLRGKVVVITFWASFDDSPLGLNRMVEMQLLDRLYEDVDDVTFVGIHDATVEPEEVRKYVEKHAISFPIGCDADPFKTFDNYGVNFIPQTVVIDKDGILRFFQVEDRLPSLIKALRRRDG